MKYFYHSMGISAQKVYYVKLYCSNHLLYIHSDFYQRGKKRPQAVADPGFPGGDNPKGGKAINYYRPQT